MEGGRALHLAVWRGLPEPDDPAVWRGLPEPDNPAVWRGLLDSEAVAVSLAEPELTVVLVLAEAPPGLPVPAQLFPSLGVSVGISFIFHPNFLSLSLPSGISIPLFHTTHPFPASSTPT